MIVPLEVKLLGLHLDEGFSLVYGGLAHGCDALDMLVVMDLSLAAGLVWLGSLDMFDDLLHAVVLAVIGN